MPAQITQSEFCLLRACAQTPRSNVWVIQNAGLGLAFKLLRQGLLDNPLSELEGAHTNLWKTTTKGLEIIKSAGG
jgi:hypothetical protein